MKHPLYESLVPENELHDGRHFMHVYFFESPDQLIKIGCSNDITMRFKSVAREVPGLKIIGHMPGPFKVEHATHRRFAEYRHHGEWFTASAALRDFIASLGPVDPIPPQKSIYQLDPAFFKLSEVAAKFQVSEAAIRKCLHNKLMRGVKIGRDWRISREAIAEFKNGNEH